MAQAWVVQFPFKRLTNSYCRLATIHLMISAIFQGGHMNFFTLLTIIMVGFSSIANAQTEVIDENSVSPVVIETIYATVASLCSFYSATGCGVQAIGHQCSRDGHIGSCSPSGKKDNNNHAKCICYTGYE